MKPLYRGGDRVARIRSKTCRSSPLHTDPRGRALAVVIRTRPSTLSNHDLHVIRANASKRVGWLLFDRNPDTSFLCSPDRASQDSCL